MVPPGPWEGVTHPCLLLIDYRTARTTHAGLGGPGRNPWVTKGPHCPPTPLFATFRQTGEGPTTVRSIGCGSPQPLPVIWSTLEDTRRFMEVDDPRMPTLFGKYKVYIPPPRPSVWILGPPFSKAVYFTFQKQRIVHSSFQFSPPRAPRDPSRFFMDGLIFFPPASPIDITALGHPLSIFLPFPISKFLNLNHFHCDGIF